MSTPKELLLVEQEVPIRDDIAHRAGVRSMTGHTTLVVAGSPSASDFRSYYLEYDGTGARIHHSKFDHNGRLVRRWLYDAQGGLSQEIAYDPKGEIQYRFELVGDGQGWTEQQMYSPCNHLQLRIAADRDASGRIVRAIYREPSGQVIRLDSYYYDSLGLLERVVMGDMGERIYQYDQRQYLKRKSRILPGMSVYGDVHEFQYDDRGLVIRMDHLHFSVTTFAFAPA